MGIKSPPFFHADTVGSSVVPVGSAIRVPLSHCINVSRRQVYGFSTKHCQEWIRIYENLFPPIHFGYLLLNPYYPRDIERERRNRKTVNDISSEQYFKYTKGIQRMLGITLHNPQYPLWVPRAQPILSTRYI